MPLGTNVDVVRVSNQKLVLNLIRQAWISRAELADRTGLTRACITQITGQMIQSGLIRECNTVATDRGRHPVQLEIIPNARYAVGINLRRSRAHMGIVNLAGEAVWEETLPYDGSMPEIFCHKIADKILPQVKNIPHESLLGAGVCAPGPLDAATGILLHPPRFDAWHNFPLASVLQNRLDMPVYLENVSNALALEEMYYGNARNVKSYIALQVNEGIGAGIIAGHTLYRGAHGMGSEVGHISIRQDGAKCPCGGRGCLEVYASVPAILAGSGYATWKALADDDSEKAEQYIRREAEYLACGLANVLNLFDLERVYLLGDITYRPERLLNAILEEIRPRLLCERLRNRSFLECGAAKNNAVAGAMPCLDNFFR